jgi:hypothetical protein
MEPRRHLEAMNTNSLPVLFARASEPDEMSLSTVLISTAILLGIMLIGHLVYAIASNRRMVVANRQHWFLLALYVAFLATIAVLAISSFGTLITSGHLLGYPLLLHLTAAGAFVFLLLGFAVFYIPQGIPTPNDAALNAHRWWLNRWSIWTMVLAGLVTAGTMFVSMFPLLDTKGLLETATLHRYAGLVVVVAAIIHVYSLACVRFRWR